MSKYSRLYQDISLSEGAEVMLTPAATHYLLTVMRLQQNDPFYIFNGRQGEWLATIKTIHKKQAVCQINYQVQEQHPLNIKSTLLFAPLKAHRLAFLLEKATELGVTHLCPVLTHHTIVRSFNLTKATAQVIEAAEQCGRLTIPQIEALKPLDQKLAHWPPECPLFVGDERFAGNEQLMGDERLTGDAQLARDTRFVSDERCQSPRLSSLLACSSLQEVAFLIGPEGGFSTEEFKIFTSYPFIHLFSLGQTILRAETASLAALSLFHCR
jgi:16S rRNA (uracil1498-N3)-methyltransferase